MLLNPMHVCLDARESDFLKDVYKKELRLKDIWQQKFDDNYGKPLSSREKKKSREIHDMREKLESEHRKSVAVWESKYRVLQERIGEAEGVRDQLEDHRRKVRELEKILADKETDITALADELKESKRRMAQNAGAPETPRSKSRADDFRPRATSSSLGSYISERPATSHSSESFRSTMRSTQSFRDSFRDSICSSRCSESPRSRQSSRPGSRSARTPRGHHGGNLSDEDLRASGSKMRYTPRPPTPRTANTTRSPRKDDGQWRPASAQADASF